MFTQTMKLNNNNSIKYNITASSATSFVQKNNKPDMQVIPKNSFSKNKISFKSLPLYNVNLVKVNHKGEQELMPAFFSYITSRSTVDWNAVMKLKDDLSDKTKYYSAMAGDFLSGLSSEAFYVIEKDNGAKNLADRIICLMQTSVPKWFNGKKPFSIKFLEVNPNQVRNATEKIKGSGEMSLFGAVRVARSHGYEKVSLRSTSDSFYEKTGFKKFESSSGEQLYELKKEDYDLYLNLLKLKYKMS